MIRVDLAILTLCMRGILNNHKSIAALGPEPVSIADDPEPDNVLDIAYLNKALEGAKAPIKSFLLDQRQIAGLGNIYVCEALHRAGISPKRKAYSVKGKRAARLLPAIQDVLHEAIGQGGTSLRDHKQPDGKLGYFVQSLKVYGREGEPCLACDTPIISIKTIRACQFLLLDLPKIGSIKRIV